MFALDGRLFANDDKVLTRFYRECLGIGVTTGRERPHSYVIPRIRFKRPVAIHRLVQVGRNLLAVEILADRILDGLHMSITNIVVR